MRPFDRTKDTERVNRFAVAMVMSTVSLRTNECSSAAVSCALLDQRPYMDRADRCSRCRLPAATCQLLLQQPPPPASTWTALPTVESHAARSTTRGKRVRPSVVDAAMCRCPIGFVLSAAPHLAVRYHDSLSWAKRTGLHPQHVVTHEHTTRVQYVDPRKPETWLSADRRKRVHYILHCYVAGWHLCHNGRCSAFAQPG